MKKNISRILLRLFLILALLVVIFPLACNIMLSLKTNGEIMSDFWRLPEKLQWNNYVRAWTKANIGKYMWNSIYTLVLSVVILVLFTFPISYTLSRFKFRGSKVIQIMYMMLMFVQSQYILVPLFIQLKNFKMTDSLFWLSFVNSAGAFSFAILLLTGFLQSIPRDYEEAAKIDGCSQFGVLFRIILPMVSPGLVTVTVLNGLNFWNEYLLSLVLISDQSKYTLPVGLYFLNQTQKYAADWGALYAGLTIILIPTILIFAVSQEKLTQGMSVGGVKG